MTAKIIDLPQQDDDTIPVVCGLPLVDADPKIIGRGSVHNHFNQERHLYSRKNFKLNRSAALAEWRELSAA